MNVTVNEELSLAALANFSNDVINWKYNENLNIEIKLKNTI